MSALRKTVAVLARLGTELQAERQAQRAKLAVAPEEVKVARLSAGLIKKLRTRLGITRGELATLMGVSMSAVGSWEYGKAKPEGHNREALVALRKLGKREVAGILAAKGEGATGSQRQGQGPKEAPVISRRFRAGGRDLESAVRHPPRFCSVLCAGV